MQGCQRRKVIDKYSAISHLPSKRSGVPMCSEHFVLFHDVLLSGGILHKPCNHGSKHCDVASIVVTVDF